MADITDPITGIVNPGEWTDPNVWLAAAVILVILTIVMIYYKVFTGERGP
jgi:hypothetical protein